MTLDEAIEHASQVADSYKDIAPACKCAHEHRQLADWLTELKALRAENAKLRELCADMWRRAMQMGEFGERFAFASEFNRRMRELGVEVPDA